MYSINKLFFSNLSFLKYTLLNSNKQTKQETTKIIYKNQTLLGQTRSESFVADRRARIRLPSADDGVGSRSLALSSRALRRDLQNRTLIARDINGSS